MRIGKGSRVLTATTILPGQLDPLVLPVEVVEVEAVAEVMVEGPVQDSTEVAEEAVVAVVAVVAEVEEVAEATDSSLIPETQAGIIHPMSGTDCLPTNRGKLGMQGPNTRNSKVISWLHMLPKLVLLLMPKDRLLLTVKEMVKVKPTHQLSRLVQYNSNPILYCHHHQQDYNHQQSV